MRAWKELGKLPANLWILCGAALVNRLGTMALPFLALYLTQHLGLTASDAGFLLATYGMGALIINPFGGWLCDRIGATRVMLASLFLTGIVLLTYPFTKTFSGLLVTTLALAFVNEIFRPAMLTATSQLAPEAQRKTAFALSRLAINLGMSVGPAAGGWLATRSFPALFWVNAAASLCAAVIVFGFRKRLVTPAATERISSLRSMTLAATDPLFRYFLLALIPVGIVFFQMDSTLPLHLVHGLGLKESDYGLLFTINTLIIIVLEIPLNSAMAHWRHSAAMALGAALFAVGFGSVMFATGFWSVAATVVIWTFGEMILFPATSAYVSDVAPPHARGAYMGAYSAVFSFCMVLGPSFGTHLMDRWGTNTLWAATFLLGLFSTALLLRLRDAVRT